MPDTDFRLLTFDPGDCSSSVREIENSGDPATERSLLTKGLDDLPLLLRYKGLGLQVQWFKGLDKDLNKVLEQDLDKDLETKPLQCFLSALQY